MTSRYVQRCLGCRKVRGVSAFRVARTTGGGRSPVCHWCETTAKVAAEEARGTMHVLLREQASLLNRLARVRFKIRAVEAEMLDAERRQSA